MYSPQKTGAKNCGLIPAFFLVLLVFLCLCPFVLAATCPCECGCPEGTNPREYGSVIGIDLGTTHSYVAVQREDSDQIEIIPDTQGNYVTPSWVSFNGDELLIGESARQAFYSNPKNTIFDAKRLLGRGLSDEDVQIAMKHWPFKVREVEGKPAISVQYQGEARDFSPEDIVGMMISRLKASAESYLGENITHAVITVPKYFDDVQRQATKDAGAKAGLTVLRVMNEPAAVAIAYGLDERFGQSRVLVYDLGGATLDVTLLELDDGYPAFDILATAGDAHLGGENLNNRVVDHFVKDYGSKTGIDITKNHEAMRKLKREVERAKHILTNHESTRIEIKNFDGGNDFKETLTRIKFEELNKDLFEKTIKSVEQVLRDSNTTKDEIADIVLVGGSTHIPKIQSLLKDYFGKEPLKGLKPDETIVYGAATLGGSLANTANCPVGCVEPNPLAVGIRTNGGVLTPILPKMTWPPSKRSRTFTTSADNQSNILIQVFEGARGPIEHNIPLGELDFTGIPPAPRGVPRIEVTFEVYVNKTLIVSVSDKGTGKTISTEIDEYRRWKGYLGDRLEEAERFEPEDEAFTKRANTFSQLSNLVHGLAHRLSNTQANNLSEPLGHEDKTSVLKVLREAGDWLDQEASSALPEDLEKKLADVKNSLEAIVPGLAGHISDVESIDANEKDWKRLIDEL